MDKKEVNKGILQKGAENAQVPFGLIGLGFTAGNFLLDRPDDAIGQAYIDRAETFNQYFNKQIDPRLKNLYLKDGGYGLTYRSQPILADIIPPTTTEFKPSDLSLAGKFQEQLSSLPPVNLPGTVITVTPGPNPARFATKEITPTEIAGQKGYVWGNPKEPQWSYALGNIRRDRTTTANPTIHLTKLDLAPVKETRFKTTGEVVNDPDLLENRAWGRRAQEGDIFFPKENILARGEVTAADLYTALQKQGATPNPLIDERRPDKYLQELAEQYAGVKQQTVTQALQELATPVEPLGVSTREQGAVPIFRQFDLETASPQQKTQAGIGKIFLEESDPKGKWRIQAGENELPLKVAKELIDEPPSAAGLSFRNYTPLRSGAFIAGAAYSPEVLNDLEQKNYAGALFKTGSSLATGALADVGTRALVSKAAQTGLTAPARALAAVSPVAAPVSVSLMLGGASPQPRAVGTYRGATVYRNPQGAFVAAPIGGKPMRLGQAIQNNKPTFVPWGSVAGTKVGPRTVGRPWWDVGQFFGR